MSSDVVRARVPKSLKRDFLSVAAAHGLTESSAIQRLVQQYVEREKEIQFRNKETMEALADSQAGLVVDGDTVLDWIASWGTENEKEPPK
jgi:predicted transcriptional regulator